MTVLKAGAATEVRLLAVVPVEEPRAAPEPAVDPRIAALTAQLADVEALLAAQREQAAIDIAAAFEEGAAEARQDEDRRALAIEQGMADALAAWRDRLDGLERLAALLAEAALGKLFDDHEDLADLVGRTLARRVRAIDAASVVRVRVSAKDFADDAALGALAARVGLPATAIVAESEAASGACEIDLAVGHLDLTVAGQWRAVAQCLATISSEEPA